MSHTLLLDNEFVRIKILMYLAALAAREINPRRFRAHLTQVILPAIDSDTPDKQLSRLAKNTISVRTTLRWLRRLGYTHHPVKKGVYVDGHERPKVRAARVEFLKKMKGLQK